MLSRTVLREGAFMLEVLLPGSWGTAMEERHKEMHVHFNNLILS